MYFYSYDLIDRLFDGYLLSIITIYIVTINQKNKSNFNIGIFSYPNSCLKIRISWNSHILCEMFTSVTEPTKPSIN